ncbi:hypothetical protein TNCV_2665111 [Trichonephila clavipes]|nr:hypothetical protein TNCV_2665111 [Trichonephila clavipes]
MPPNTLQYTRSTCSLNQWVRSLVGLITSAGTGEYFPPLQSRCRNCGGGDRGRVAIYRPFGELRRAKIVLSPVWCSRPTTGVPLAHATMNFVGLDLTASDSICSTCESPQGITTAHTNPANMSQIQQRQKAKCPAVHMTTLGGSHLSIPTDLMDGIDKATILSIPTAISLLVSDLETEEVRETRNIC